MTRVTDSSGQSWQLGTSRVVLGAADQDPGTLLAVDTLRRLLALRGSQVRVAGVPVGWEHLNVHPGLDPGPADVVLSRPWGVAPPYRLEHRLTWLAGWPVEEAGARLVAWRADVARWAEAPSKPMCAEFVEQVLEALDDDLGTARAVAALQRSLTVGLPDGCLFETWAWADRLLGLDLVRDVGRA